MGDDEMNIGHLLDPVRDGSPFYEVFCRDPRFEANRNEFERMWLQFADYADHNFVTALPKEFISRYWEMFSACIMMHMGFPMQRNRIGPDIKTSIDSQTLWIECTAASNGSGSNKVPEVVYNSGVQTVPDHAITLRFTSRLEDKVRVFQQYMNTRVVDENDYKLIALNGAEVNFSRYEVEIPRVVKCLLGIGDFTIKLNSSYGTPVGAGYDARASINNANGSNVSTSLFSREDFKDISAVIYSWVWPFEIDNSSMFDIIVHNPNAKKKLQNGSIAAKVEYYVDGGLLKIIKNSAT
ncbi:MAG: hypothetical protein Q8M07_31485 [Prosthecobacter sp.]|nr:hypothetical protein [Prosthecobacter sp.]